ncbi:uncharacterized protein [Aegilops tauschii subsp. strangulata]|uniref:uncharacterized protein n=1 Tax=Aegilops tauschii subsp. strangulata TaxID=200361 RepID=UPI003CC87B5E
MPQKILLALLVASRKLRHYFQGHPIKVVSTYPLERVLRSPNAAGRVAEWNIKLQAFQLDFSTTRFIKGVTLADFMVEWNDEPSREVCEDRSLLPEDEAPDGWVMYFDGAFARQGTGAGPVLISPAKDTLYYAVQLYGELYRKRPNDVSLRCISREKGHELLADIHGGDCGHHSSSRTLMGKAFRSGFYWPTALNDATELVRYCEACQFHSKQIHQPAQGL